MRQKSFMATILYFQSRGAFTPYLWKLRDLIIGFSEISSRTKIVNGELLKRQ